MLSLLCVFLDAFKRYRGFEMGVNDGELGCMATWMGCDIDELPFTYLGLPIGENMGRVKSWKPVGVEGHYGRGGGLSLGARGVWYDIVKIGEEIDGGGNRVYVVMRGGDG
ncbi:hypothetical protein Tco_0034610 [Tanacetum coccineum]